MKFNLNKNSFVKDVLLPIATLNDRATISLTETGITSIVNNAESNIILYLKMNIPCSEKADLNIGDIKKLCRALDCIDQEDVIFDFAPGMIKYETEEVTFKYHLLQPGLIQKHTIDINKIDNLKIDTTFNISCEIFSKILRGTSFATDTNKIYFYTRDNQVYACLTDYTTPQSDLIGFRVSEGFSGIELKTEIPISVDTFKLLQANRSKEVKVSVNTKMKILLFDISTQSSHLKYIVSGLVK